MSSYIAIVRAITRQHALCGVNMYVYVTNKLFHRNGAGTWLWKNTTIRWCIGLPNNAGAAGCDCVVHSSQPPDIETRRTEWVCMHVKQILNAMKCVFGWACICRSVLATAYGISILLSACLNPYSIINIMMISNCICSSIVCTVREYFALEIIFNVRFYSITIRSYCGKKIQILIQI